MLAKLNGWKSILGYLLASVASGAPMLLPAVKAALATHSVVDISNAAGQLLLALGLAHKAWKNVAK